MSFTSRLSNKFPINWLLTTLRLPSQTLPYLDYRVKTISQSINQSIYQSITMP